MWHELQKRSSSRSACSFSNPYRDCSRPTNSSRLPSICVMSSSVSLPHCCLTCPLNCFQFPLTWSQFMRFAPQKDVNPPAKATQCTCRGPAGRRKYLETHSFSRQEDEFPLLL